MRVMLADDSALFRIGLQRLLEDMGVVVVASAASGGELAAAALAAGPADVAILDLRMPPTKTDEGLRVARDLRRMRPALGVLLLSTYADAGAASELLELGSGGLGYLLKDRVDDPEVLRDALGRLARKEVVVDAELVAALVHRRRSSAAVRALTPRERTVLALIAEGRSNAGIGSALHLSPKTVETHIGSIFAKLELPDETSQHRRVGAALAWLQHAAV